MASVMFSACSLQKRFFLWNFTVLISTYSASAISVLDNPLTESCRISFFVPLDLQSKGV